MQSLKGQLILDGGKLVGSEFHRTVVLICDHDAAGALGLVLNRPSKHTLSEVLTESLPEPLLALPLFLGGPVQPQALTCLILDPTASDDTETTVLPGLRLLHSLEELVEPTVASPAPAQVRFFAGYAGWGPGQLDGEMKQAAWLTHPGAPDLVFHSRPADLWKTILRAKGPEYRLLAEAPDDSSHN